MYLLNHINTQGSRAALPSLCSIFRLLPAMFFSFKESLFEPAMLRNAEEGQ